MTLAEALKTMSKRSKLTYKKWGERAGCVSYSVITTPITRGDAKVSTLVKLANAAGYDVVLVRRLNVSGEDPIVIDDMARNNGKTEAEK